MDEEESGQEYAYVFTIEYGPNGVETDWLIDGTPLVGVTTDQEYLNLCDVHERLEPGGSKEIRRIFQGLKTIMLRGISGGVYMVKTESPLTREQLDKVLQTKQQMGQLSDWLQAAKY